MKAMQKIGRILDRIDSSMAVLAGILTVLVMLFILFEISMRYFLNRPTIWTIELSRLALVYITFLGVAWVLKNDRHVKIDLVLNRLTRKSQAIVNMVASLVGAIVCLVIAWYGVKVTWESYQLGVRMLTELRTPQFLTVAIIPVGTFFFFIRFARKSHERWLEWRSTYQGDRQVQLSDQG
ncbi:MAG: TRAP transporter small permease [Chloroflexi bacterium]|nr:TRAP transporter small permease [Chloroflexota bacterium]